MFLIKRSSMFSIHECGEFLIAGWHKWLGSNFRNCVRGYLNLNIKKSQTFIFIFFQNYCHKEVDFAIYWWIKYTYFSLFIYIEHIIFYINYNINKRKQNKYISVREKKYRCIYTTTFLVWMMQLVVGMLLAASYNYSLYGHFLESQMTIVP
jgi:hypothetical protein